MITEDTKDTVNQAGEKKQTKKQATYKPNIVFRQEICELQKTNI